MLVMGSCHEGVDLPSIDLDYRAVAGMRVASSSKTVTKVFLFVEPMGKAVGISASEAALREYLAGVPGSQVRVLQAAPEFLSCGLSNGPYGVRRPHCGAGLPGGDGSSVLGAAQQFGKSIPREFSLVARDDHPHL